MIGYGRGRGYGRGMGYGRGRGSGLGLGPSGFCVCPKCGNKVVHQRGIPCYQQRCPICGSPMVREGIESINPPNLGYREPSRVDIREEHSSGIRVGIPRIDKDKCIGCGDCIKRCPFDAIKIINGKAEIDAMRCRKCRICIPACPEGAIS